MSSLLVSRKIDEIIIVETQSERIDDDLFSSIIL